VLTSVFRFRMSGSLLLNIAYGIDAKSMEDPYILIIENSVKRLKIALSPGSYLVDIIPLRAFS
jgi:hypothetical protein